MRFVVFGAGGVGGVVGGRLAQHGHEVALIARGAHYDAIRTGGLLLESPGARVRIELPIFNHPSGVTWTANDIVLLAMKTQDTPAALESLAAVAPATAPIVSMQNGVANEAMALRYFPNVYGICVMCPTGYQTPGAVQAWSAPTTGLLDVGCYPSGVDDTAEAIASVLRTSTFQSVPRADIMRWKYGKLIMNLANAVEALCGRLGRTNIVVDAAKREAIACFTAAGIPFVGEEEDSARRKDHIQVQAIDGRTRPGGSTWQSLGRGVRTIETDYLNGEIVLLGRRHGIPTPANALLQRLSRIAAANGSAPGAMLIEELERLYAVEVAETGAGRRAS
jgi:2-dehydropantoate 2-reductase